ncbi:MAG: M56 family metallopeptidase [Prolixibacteraceae bacterium]|nr:M56 family metallopeptidase [Prolixibacteraceae bacterium]
METFLDYLIKSSICITAFYIAFRWTLKKEKTFAFNRFLLIGVLVLSVAIPLVKMPSLFNQNIDLKVFPVKNTVLLPAMDETTMEVSKMPASMPSASTEKSISAKQVMAIIYASGLVISFLLLILGLAKLTMLLWKVKIYRKNSYRLALVNHPITPMNFGRFIILSKKDYSEHKSEILGHELAHIKFGHTFDLLIVELIKLFHWFNPFVYALKNDLKEIQEFQVDQHLLNTGTDSKAYQLLLIRKSVGDERYALSNSFNHCQIKNRIVMMNKSKKQKGKAWKVAIFLPVVFLMFGCFSKTNEKNAETKDVLETSTLDIEGAWRYVLSLQIRNGTTFTLIDDSSNYDEMKIWSKDHFAFAGNQGFGSYPFGGNGKYKIEGNYYEEIVLTAPLKKGNEPEVFKMRMELKNDTLIQIWPAEANGNYDPKNVNIIKMVRMN